MPIGVDIVAVARVARVYARYGARFLERAFHPREAARARALPAPRLAAFLAARWAAKEALHKALRVERLLFTDVEVVSEPSGAPRFELHGAARAAGARLDLQLSVSHEERYAVAFVVATARAPA